MMGPLDRGERDRLERLPPMSRARAWRLYALDGERWLDCWLDDGRALLGHRPPRVGRRMKNEMDRGLYAPYPSRWNGRLEKALLRTWPGFSAVRVYENYQTALGVLNRAPVDPLDESDAALAWGRPFLPVSPATEILCPRLPSAGLGGAAVLLFRDPDPPVRASDRLSPLLLSALCRTVEEIESLRDEGWKVEYSLFPSDKWKQRGPYMRFLGGEKAYSELFEHFFSRRVLIAPSLRRATILPPLLSEAETKLLNKGGASL